MSPYNKLESAAGIRTMTCVRHIRFVLPGLLALLFAGCSTRPQTGQPRPPNWESNPPVSAKPHHTNAPPVVVKPPNPPTPVAQNVWLPLDAWGKQHDSASLRRLAALPSPTYSLTVSNGALIIQIGSRIAFWNGVEILLGFPPELAEGRVYMNRLDLLKNLDALTSPFAPIDRTNRLVVLDPGHGGGNTGTHSVVDGRFEKEFTLDWAKRLAPLLEERGWHVLLTHTNDMDMTLPERVAFAETNSADLFISLHFNSMAPNEEPAGLETYCLTPTGMPSTLTREYPDDPAQVYPNNSFDEQNVQLAMHLQRALVGVNGHLDRGVCRARFIGVLRGQRRPAVLIEGGFLSNPTEARRIADPDFRQKLAEAIANALTDTNVVNTVSTNIDHAVARP